jgi:hypothetical protein
MGKYETYLRDKEKMVLIPHVGAVNVASAIALGLVTPDDINETKRASRAKRESTTSLAEFLTNRELDGEKV